MKLAKNVVEEMSIVGEEGSHLHPKAFVLILDKVGKMIEILFIE